MSRIHRRRVWLGWGEGWSRSKAAAGSLRTSVLRVMPKRRSTRRLALVSGVAAIVVAGIVGVVPRAFAADPCAPLLNPIACENSKPGTSPDDWDIAVLATPRSRASPPSISVNVGRPIGFKIEQRAEVPHRHLPPRLVPEARRPQDRHRRSPSPLPPTNQPPTASPISTTEIYDCGNWAVSASWTVPSTAVSGVYIAQLTTRHHERRREPHHVRRAQRRQQLRRALPDLRRDLAGLQHLRRLRLLPGRSPTAGPTRSATTGRSRPAADSPGATSCSPTSTR